MPVTRALRGRGRESTEVCWPPVWQEKPGNLVQGKILPQKKRWRVSKEDAYHLLVTSMIKHSPPCTLIYTYKQTNRHIIHEWLEHFSKQAPSILLICIQTDRHNWWMELASTPRQALLMYMHTYLMDGTKFQYTPTQSLHIYIHTDLTCWGPGIASQTIQTPISARQE